jgi:hypothetical protein
MLRCASNERLPNDAEVSIHVVGGGRRSVGVTMSPIA